jgi:hypothetical protein
MSIDGMSIGHKFNIQATKILAAMDLDLPAKPEEMKKVRTALEEKTKNFKKRDSMAPGAKPPLDQYKREAAQWDKLLQPYYKNP